MKPSVPAPWPRLVADIGGTNARLGWIASRGSAVQQIARYPCADHPGPAEVVEHYLGEQRLPRPAAIAIGIATPVVGDAVSMTNLAWSFSIDELQRRLGVSCLRVLNDFAALAWGLPTTSPDELRQVGAGIAAEGAPLALIGPGTGLGVSGLLRTPAGLAPIVGEGGHASLAAADTDEERLIAVLRRRFGHVSAERVLSGAGLVNLYEALCELHGQPAEALDAEAISERAAAGDPLCTAAVDRFFSFLGSVAGNLALTLGARGGVYIAGGIVPRLGSAIDASSFRERFEAKGRFRSYLAAVPTWLVLDASMLALRGADAALDT